MTVSHFSAPEARHDRVPLLCAALGQLVGARRVAIGVVPAHPPAVVVVRAAHPAVVRLGVGIGVGAAVRAAVRVRVGIGVRIRVGVGAAVGAAVGVRARVVPARGQAGRGERHRQYKSELLRVHVLLPPFCGVCAPLSEH
jgi:hypothetical protein